MPCLAIPQGPPYCSGEQEQFSCVGSEEFPMEGWDLIRLHVGGKSPSQYEDPAPFIQPPNTEHMHTRKKMHSDGVYLNITSVLYANCALMVIYPIRVHETFPPAPTIGQCSSPD